MRIGVGVGGKTIERARGYVKGAADDGFASAWFNNIFGLDAILACAVGGNGIPIEVGTFVTPIQPRHPHAMAQQGLSAYDACDGRFTLGIGLSHQIVVEDMFGMSYEKPARYMREYLSVLMPLLDEGKVAFNGEVFRVNGMVEKPRDGRPSVLIAALGPAMLKIAGELADGTATWMTGPKTLGDHTVPTLVAATEAAGRPAPRIAAALPVCVTNDIPAARERAAKEFAVYGSLPSYRAMLDREGAGGPADIAVVGDEDEVTRQVRSLVGIGVTDLVAGVFGDEEQVKRTGSLLRSVAAELD
ncbi:MAG: TIGR03564 family F420-dependent LLM class oxidoreductase [Actinomycetes bacterium]